MPTLDPDTPAPSAAQPLTPQAALDGWDQLKRQMALLLRNAKPDATWLAQLVETMGRMRSLAQRDTDIVCT